MRIRSIHLKDFKRFVDLTIKDIPATARLVILVGPSGSGKSSVFEAINVWGKDQRNSSYDSEYLIRDGEPTNSGLRIDFRALGVTINADNPPSNLGEACYIRSAYRHTSKFSVSTMAKLMRVNIGDLMDSEIFPHLILKYKKIIKEYIGK